MTQLEIIIQIYDLGSDERLCAPAKLLRGGDALSISTRGSFRRRVLDGFENAAEPRNRALRNSE